MEGKLQEETNLNHILLDNIPGVALLIRPETREIVLANKHALEAGAILGKQCFDSWGEFDEPCPWCLAPELWATGKPLNSEVEISGTYWDTFWIPITKDLYLHYALDISERKKTEKTMQLINKTTVGEIGEDFLRSLTKQLAISVGTRYALVGEVVESEADRIRTIAMWASGDYGENIEYKLAKSPCAEVIKQDFCIYSENVQQSFPDDHLLTEMGVESYVGIRLRNSSNDTVGILAALHDKPLDDILFLKPILTTFALRAAAEVERKRVEDKFLMQQNFLSKAQEIGKIGTWELDIKKNILVWTEETYRIFGLPIGTKLTYETFLNCVHPDDREYVDREWKAAFTKKPYDIEHRLLMSDGSIKWVREKAELEFDGQGNVLKGTGFAQDITERKQEEEKIIFSNRFLEISNKHVEIHPLLNDFIREIKKLSGTKAIGIRLLDEKGNIPYQAYEGFSHEFYKKESLLTIKSDQCMCVKIVKGDFDPTLPFFTKSGSFYSNDTTRLIPSVFEKDTCNECYNAGYRSMALVPIRAADRILGLIHLANKGKNKIALNSVNILEKAAMQLGTAILRVMAEEKLKKAYDTLEQRVRERTAELEQTYNQLLHAEKLGAIGKLSASIAHEFGSPIFGIRNVLSEINANSSCKETDPELVDLAIRECDRVTNLLHKLRDFNRPTSSNIEPINIHEIVDDMLLFCNKKFLKRKITVQKHYASDIPKIYAVEDQIKQVILNLLNNAEEAISDKGGTIKISTEHTDKEVAIRIEDSGVGIKSGCIDKIFEPFFTTKSAVKGTGLGLSTVYGIISSHGGKVDVESDHGKKGAVFIITLPIDRTQDDKENNFVG